MFLRSPGPILAERPRRTVCGRLAEAGGYLSAADLAGTATAEAGPGPRIGTQEPSGHGPAEDDLRRVDEWRGDVLLRAADPATARAAAARLRERRAG
ncbi:hypothetical protein [Marinitenerispora sediminis]|uniref:Uncharacterized protein n=1 Tax=Marinitenerispora sediminis TaxID=1931232 RepID=A0A368T711_9ACTN|nr:hypothetical protein [Marinitenerispora sediminis]RCV54650.1 hypothetical protein DEF23_15565 [Marinitenerispora sediminis]RCV56407.1 hypothetical protein DEF28_03640 [Marinitenerispora sediminis]RCV59751.1 hypothetical protein DEF24_08965 [Marinitenerispora sediminis]